MSLIGTFLDKLNIQEVNAHCDVPCGIYDPHRMQVAAHTVIRMIDLMHDLEKNHKTHDAEFRNTFFRHVMVKEEHAEIVKHEARILWGDYFKPEHLKEYPDLHELVWNIMKLCSKVKQGTDKKVSEDLLEATRKLAEIFWKTKGIEIKRVKAPYPSGGEFVLPML
ncbi:MAG: superoxide dismutase, Ni [Candidatus Aenigmarchaeota archaeon]|nr:superoxide dismutase, Ni [Candidatus Aenigmarchaeota archaeon]